MPMGMCMRRYTPSYFITPQYELYSSATRAFQNPLQIFAAVKQLQLYNELKTYYELSTERAGQCTLPLASLKSTHTPYFIPLWSALP